MFLNSLEKLRRENNCLNASLAYDLQVRIDNMIAYMCAKGMSICALELFRSDILGMAQESRMRGEDFSTILGMSDEGFCNSILKNYVTKKSERLIYILYQLSLYFFIYALAQILLFGYYIPISLAHFVAITIYLLTICFSIYRAYPIYKKGIYKKYPHIVTTFCIALVLFLGSAFIKGQDAAHVVGWFSFILIPGLIFFVMRLIWNRYVRKNFSI